MVPELAACLQLLSGSVPLCASLKTMSISASLTSACDTYTSDSTQFGAYTLQGSDFRKPRFGNYSFRELRMSEATDFEG